MRYRNMGKSSVLDCAVVVTLACGICLFNASASRAQEGEARPPARGKISQVLAKPLDWPLPPGVDKSYGTVDGHRLHVYVDELAAISEKYRDAGNQWWGRIPGMASGIEAQNWAKEKFKAIGVPTETVTIPDPQDLPKSWDLSVSANGKTLHLDSSDPTIDFPRFAPSMKGDQVMDTVW